MSAIFGILNLDGRPVTRDALHRMADALAHRGPDGGSSWHGAEAALGHLMMWTTPESLRERLPLSLPAANLTITADARLDNRDELFRLLGISPGDGSGLADSELILRSYEKWGEGCVERLLGDFVFAVWDGRRRELFCARDHFGAKHFYYHHAPRKLFTFASEPKGILALPAVPRRLNELAVVDHLLPTYEDKVITLYEGVLRLPAGHCMTVGQRGINLRRYYEADLGKELRLRTDAEYAEAFRDVFTEAVRCRMRSAFPVGAMLSGGLDSSSIACTARLLNKEGAGRELHTFSGVFPSLADIAPESDERRYQKAVTSLGGFVAHDVVADAVSPLTDIQKIQWHMDNALPAPNMYMDWAIFKAAKEHGVRVLFSGNDGDTIVSYGYEDFFEYTRRGRLVALLKQSIALSDMNARVHSKKWSRTFKKAVLGWGVKPALRSVVPESAVALRRALRGRANSNRGLVGHSRQRPFNLDFARRMNIEDRYWELQRNTYPPNVRARVGHWFAITSGSDVFMLESFEKAGAAHSLEVRYPFFDRRVVEFCLALPPGQKLQNGWTRSILRRAMEGVLPPSIQWRVDKSDISAHVRLNLLGHERALLDEIVLQNPGAIGPYVDVAELRSAYGRYASDPMKYYAENFSILLAVNLALWLREFSATRQGAPQLEAGAAVA